MEMIIPFFGPKWASLNFDFNMKYSTKQFTDIVSTK